MENESNLKLYSLGIVVQDKVIGSDFINVTPIEKMSIEETGIIGEKTSDYSSTHSNTSNTDFKSEIKSSNFLRAKWIPFGFSNRTTAPDVYKNETVILFKFGNVEEYYWTTIFREPNLRRQETVLTSYSNLKSGLEAFNTKTSYWTLVDTRGKKVKLHTSDNDGEACTYDVVIDTASGLFNLTDSLGNNILLNSTSGTLSITCAVVNINAPTINLNGNVTVSGSLTAKQSANVSGTLSSTGNILTSSNLSVKGNISRGSCPCC